MTRSGRRTVVEHRNELPVPTVVHLHGGHTPQRSDGAPLDLVLPVGGGSAPVPAGGIVSTGSREYDYPGAQRAATLWYHDHRMDFTGPAVYRGLAGFHLVHDGVDDALPLPRGERDIPLMLVDRSFNTDGTLRYPSVDPALRDQPGVDPDHMEGMLGDVILVNGAPWPVLDVAAVRYRFRFLNAANARVFELAMRPSPARGFIQIGSDGGLLGAPVEHTSLRLAPAERMDVVVDLSEFAPGTEVTVLNLLGQGGAGSVLRLRVTRRAPDDTAVPARLAEIEPLSAPAEVTREFRFLRRRHPGGQGWSINGLTYDPMRVDAHIPLARVERWRLVTDVHHPVHVHLDHFQVLRRGPGGPGEYDGGWKDTLDLRGAESAEIAVRFRDYPGNYVLHCHNLEHEDLAMMATLAIGR
ncbi:MAG: multicopper oxidase family protein [Geodermatophilaceae bacterium]